jgi:hypothetical protein
MMILKIVQFTIKNHFVNFNIFCCYFFMQDDDGWESDHSESTNSATEDNNMYHDTSPVKQRITNIPKDHSLLAQNDDSRTSGIY